MPEGADDRGSVVHLVPWPRPRRSVSDEQPTAPPERPKVFEIDPPKVMECDACLERHRHRFGVVIGWDEKYICRACARELFTALDAALPKGEV